MRDFAIVKKIENQKIEVVSLISDACVTCNSTECAKNGKSFYVLNKKSLPIKENNIIRIGFPRLLQAFLGIVALLFPIFSAFTGFLLSPYICQKFILELNQINRALVTGVFFISASFFVFIISRTNIHLTSPEIIQIM